MQPLIYELLFLEFPCLYFIGGRNLVRALVFMHWASCSITTFNCTYVLRMRIQMKAMAEQGAISVVSYRSKLLFLYTH